MFSGRQDGSSKKGVGLAPSPHAWKAVRHYQAVSSLVTMVGTRSVMVAYAQSEQSSIENEMEWHRIRIK